MKQTIARVDRSYSREPLLARRHVREGEERIARQQVLTEKTESPRYLGDAAQGTKLLSSMRFTLDLARHHLQRSESRRIRNARHPKAAPALCGAALIKHDLGRTPPLLKP